MDAARSVDRVKKERGLQYEESIDCVFDSRSGGL
jgi:hypothetical protein